MRLLNMLKKSVFFKRQNVPLDWICVDPQCFQSNRYRINTDYYDGVVSISFDGKWVKQLIDPDEAKRWCARDARKRSLKLNSELVFDQSHSNSAEAITEG